MFFVCLFLLIPRALKAEPCLTHCGGRFDYYIRDAVVDSANKVVGGFRYVISRDDIGASWHLGNDKVKKLSALELAQLPLGGVVPYAPGTLLKIPDDYHVYAVTRSRVLRWIDTASTAAKKFGSDWENKIKEIPGSWLQHYQFGLPIINETWFSQKEMEVSEAALYETTNPAWREKAAVLRDQERLTSIQEIIIPFLHDIYYNKGKSVPVVHGKWLLGEKGSDWVYATDTMNSSFRKVPIGSCPNLINGKCIMPAPDAQINTNICGTQAPYGYMSKDGFELSFCIESNDAKWVPRNDDFDDSTAIQNLRPSWYKYTMKGLDRISP